MNLFRKYLEKQTLLSNLDQSNKDVYLTLCNTGTCNGNQGAHEEVFFFTMFKIHKNKKKMKETKNMFEMASTRGLWAFAEPV